jgi:hypothetical protein
MQNLVFCPTPSLLEKSHHCYLTEEQNIALNQVPRILQGPFIYWLNLCTVHRAAAVRSFTCKICLYFSGVPSMYQ